LSTCCYNEFVCLFRERSCYFYVPAKWRTMASILVSYRIIIIIINFLAQKHDGVTCATKQSEQEDTDGTNSCPTSEAILLGTVYSAQYIFRPRGRKIVLGKYNCPSTWTVIQCILHSEVLHYFPFMRDGQ